MVGNEPVINKNAIMGEVRLGMRLDLQPNLDVEEGASALGERIFPTVEESAEMTEMIAKKQRKSASRVPVGTGT